MKSGFTTILTMIILMVIGAALIPFVDIGSQPRERQGSKLVIEFQWPHASAKVVEQNVTSKIEGVVSAINGIAELNSESRYGSGRITINLKPETNPSTAKFEIASLIKQIRKGFPKEVSYPVLSGGDVVSEQKKDDDETLLLTYHIHSEMSPSQLEDWVKSHIEPPLLSNEDIKRLEIYGGRSKYLDIQYDPQMLKNVGVSAYEIEDGIKAFVGKEDIVGDVVYENHRGKHRLSLLLTTEAFGKPLSEMPIKTIKDGNDEKIVYLNDLATYEIKERLPEYYYRVNGLETVYMNIYVSSRANMIRLSSMLREYMDGIIPNLPGSISMELSYDGAEKEQGQLYRLVTRSIVSLLILLLFVWIVSRSWKYLTIIFITLIADILISVLAYWLFDIRLHVFSLAGITVSLGLVIDASIVMVDHYSYYKDRRAFLSILAALLTTIGSLILIYFMPDYIQKDLYDFAWIVIINLCTALIVALWFVPALVDKFVYNKQLESHSIRSLRRVVKFSSIYESYICFTQKRKWIYYIILFLAFGIPIHLLPNKIGDTDIYSVEKKELTWYQELYNATLGNRKFINNVKEPLSKWVGGSMRLFSTSLSSNTYYHDDSEMQLYISARMPQGGTASELNEKVLILEDYLKTEENIRRWETTVGSWGANIVVSFTNEALKTSAPFIVESKVIGKVMGIGGADWATRGVSLRGFSNSIMLQYRSNSITLSGYNYDRLYHIAETVEKKLRNNSRVVDIIIETPGHEHQEDEYYVEYDLARLAALGIDVSQVHNAVQEMVSVRDMGMFDDGQLRSQMQLTSSQIDKFDLWQLNNSFVRIDDRSIMLRDVMSIHRREAKNVIPKKNQEYTLRVAFNVLGSYTFSSKLIEKVTDELNHTLPVGYKCINSSYSYYKDTGEQYWLLLVVVAIIFFICSVLFESLRRPLVIILLIPTSFIGTFLTFYFSKVDFGTGGFASMVLLCGLVVNAGIYILSEYDNVRERRLSLPLSTIYLKAYNHKIVPVFLTILSTVFGLVPFIWDGSEDQFWYSFAVGTIGGLLCSIVAIIIFLPIFVKLNLNKK